MSPDRHRAAVGPRDTQGSIEVVTLLEQFRPTPAPRSIRSTRSPLIVVANRLPVSPSPDGGWRTADGGLVQALSGVVDAGAATWLGWDPSGRLDPLSTSIRECILHRVRLDPMTAEGYYDGFANRTLWPLLHHLVQPATLDPRWWPAYRKANSVFAQETRRLCLSRSARHGPLPTVWVHDYHLMLVPAMLRRRHLAAPVAFFLHTPFPPAGILVGLPGRAELLSGALGADLVAFQTEMDLDNFARSCRRYLDTAVIDNQLINRAGRVVRLEVHPASIDTPALTRQATSEAVRSFSAHLHRRYGGRRIILGVDRLDYTKGIPERLRAIEIVAQRRPDVLRDSVFVQLAVPTRQNVPEYRRLRDTVAAQVQRINRALLPTFGRYLIDYRYQHLDRDDLIAHYVAADTALVTPLRDGMNLVAKEYVAAQAATNSSGALVLSRHAGAATQIGDHAILCNPHDPTDLANAVEQALQLPQAKRRHNIAAMGDQVCSQDAQRWAAHLLANLHQTTTRLIVG